MAAIALRKDEGVGLALAVAAHVALVAFLVLRPLSKPVVLPPERMTVTISDETGPRSTSPDPSAQAAPDVAPELGEPAPALPEPQPEPAPPPPKPQPPKPQPPLPPPPPPKLLPPKPAPRPVPAPKPIPKAIPPRPQPRVIPPQPRPAVKQQPQRPQTPARPQTRPQTQTRTVPNPGGRTIGNDFLRGPGATPKGNAQTQGADAPSKDLVSSWASSIGSRVIRPWDACAPSGAEAEKLRIVMRFVLDRGGGIASMEEPVVTGETDANRAQVSRYKECAVRAIRSSAPFPGLPPEYYDYWKSRRLNFRKE